MYPIPLLGGSHLLRALGIPADNVFGGLEDYRDSMDQLQDLQDTFGAFGLMPVMLANLLQSGGIPAPMCMPPPNMGCCGCPGQYAQPQGYDFGAAPGGNFFERLMARGKGARFERMLEQNPFARAQVEMMLGGRIIPDGRQDGKITVQPFGHGGIPGGANPSAISALGLLDQINRAAMGAGGGAFSPGAFHSMMMGALANMLGGAGGAGGAGGPGGLFSPSDFLPGVPGQPHQPGQPHPAQAAFGMHNGGDASAVLNDPTLTVEDKVTLMIMLIMKKMDKDIEKQANYINKLQQQQGGGGGKGGKGGKGGGGGSSPSIDVETMKLKRMIDKRSQMFDMLRQIIDKYNQTAKGIIDSMGR